MHVALVHARPGLDPATDGHAQRVARFLVERGDAVTWLANERADAGDPRVEVELLKPFALSAAGRAQAFDKAVQAWAARVEPEVVYSLGRTSRHEVLRPSMGIRTTRIELAADPELAKSSEERALLEIEALGMQRDRTRLVAVPSELVGKDAMKRHHVLPELLRLVRPGVDLARFSPEQREAYGRAARTALGVDADAFVVVFRADGWTLHGLDRLLKVWDAVSADRPKARLVVAGSDARAAEHEKAVASSRSKSSVRFVGPQPDRSRLMHAADLFVLPTRYDAFSLAALEALACGLPVVTTAANGVAELIEEDVNGIALFGDDLRQTLYQQLLSWTKPERAGAAKDAARAAAERCPLESEASETAAVLDEAAALSREPGA
jgi:glycosyltransferase involved in cell wall biosynthesis